MGRGTKRRFRARAANWRPKLHALVLSLLCIHVLACGTGVQVGRIGKPTPLSSGVPRNTCEHEKWVELTPARVVAEGMVSGVTYNTYYNQVYEGFGVFETDSNDPEDVEDLWTEMDEPELEKRHMKSITPVDDAYMDSIYWSLGSIAGSLGGIGIGAAVQQESGVAAGVIMVSGLVVGLVCVIGALAAQPSGPDQVYADARRKLFIPEEDDMVSVERGVDRINIKRRTQCGGAYTEPTGAVKPVVKPAPANPTPANPAPANPTPANPTPANPENEPAPAAPQPERQDIEPPTAADGATTTHDAAVVPNSESPTDPPTSTRQ